MITITTDLDIISSGVMPVIHMSQYDSDFSLVFNIFASRGTFTMPSGTTAEIRGTKTDGNGYDAAATVDGNTVTVTGDEQMTAVSGRNIYEIALYYNSKRLNTINFVLDVEHAALDADTITSESVLRELDAIVEGAEVATEAAADAEAAAADAEAALETITALGVNLPEVVKTALLNCFENVAWATDNGQTYYDDLVSALSDKIPSYITAVFTQGSDPIYTDTDIEDFRTSLVVTAYFDDNTSAVVENYTLSGTLSAGTNTITVTYRTKTTTFTVTGVIDFYNIDEWSLSGGNLMLREGGCGSTSSTPREPQLLGQNTTTPRYSIYTIHGVRGFWDEWATQVLTDKFPIPVPDGATSATVNITPNTQYFAMLQFSYNGTVYSRLSDSGWKTSGNTIALQPNAEFVTVNLKYDSAGTSYPTPPTNVEVIFE